MNSQSTSSVQVQNALGLHVRPAVMLSKLAKQYDALIEVSRSEEGPWVKASSSALVMRMKIRKGQWLYVRAEGIDAQGAVSAVISFIAEGH